MTYRNLAKSLRKKNEAEEKLKLQAKIFTESDTFDEYQLACAAHGAYHSRAFDEFWHFYLFKNYGMFACNMVMMSISVILTVLTAIAMSCFSSIPMIDIVGMSVILGIILEIISQVMFWVNVDVVEQALKTA